MNQSQMQEIERFVRLMLSRKRLFVSIALLVMTSAVVFSYSLPKQYEATSTVFIEQSVINDLVRGIAMTPSVSAKVRLLSVSILSRAMLMRVLNILDKDVHFKTDAQREAYVNNLRERIIINLRERQGVFYITFRDTDPKYARDVVNTLTQVYIEESTASKRDESLEATRFLSDQIESFKKRIDAVENEINAYKSEHGLRLAVNEGIIRFEIAEAEKKLEALRLRRLELEAQERLLASGYGGQGRLVEMERALSSLLATYTENHPRVTRLKSEMDALRASPDGAPRDVNAQARAMIRVELNANSQLEERQLAIIEEQKQMLREIPVIRTGLNELIRKKENETVIYNQLVGRYGQSEVSKQMEMENKAVTFRIVDPAILPEFPVSPKRLQIILMGMVAGLGIAFVCVFLLDKVRHSVKSQADLRSLKQQILAVVPAMRKPDEERKQKRADRRFLAVATAYFSLIVVVAASEAMGKPYVETLLDKVKGTIF
ncbi:polysaccharide chain length determinant protein, PEP-CTERM locus subfamily [Alkalidesulfovibrio alkalitolerans DSM 16529]|jgi:polysaccharide chain length determinant protein (PEP-CTERM system associated)|uniref:Polysaccharide chain length determinant protein, PEP-CTERM locus subfamily n=1 Tax=Alkalidesulfovibrio alkalitolerans DSM 16529 TaxID=1121439 RepID=S7T0E7_9BACT|nr:XrtA system polysaccharide chain length determinant [Alkalidesulfovibrio alkalitolerans]EPR30552.1 polysaccharide chain length determinant protein, PEP-CTERM locus subfamily [Alkalidesulfovibrio alkalitolerans DSM 16529]